MTYLHGMWTLPQPWRKQFAGWARVNHTFFDASTAVLWERMDSLLPFLHILQSAGGGKSDNVPTTLVCYKLSMTPPSFDKQSSRNFQEFLPRIGID